MVVLMNVFAMGIFDSGKTMSIILCEEMVLLSTINASGTVSSYFLLIKKRSALKRKGISWRALFFPKSRNNHALRMTE